MLPLMGLPNRDKGELLLTLDMDRPVTGESLRYGVPILVSFLIRLRGLPHVGTAWYPALLRGPHPR